MVKPKSKVSVLVSMGQPDVVFTNGKNILRINGATGGKFDPVAQTSAEEKDPTWNAAGTHVAYTADGRLMLKNVVKENSRRDPAAPRPARPTATSRGRRPPRRTSSRCARTRQAATTTTSAWPRSSSDGTDVCLQGRAVVHASSAPSTGRRTGSSILGVGVKLPAGTGVFGIVRWTLKHGKPPFSADAGDWNTGKFVSDIDTPGKGVLDAAFSPDGKRLALVSNMGSSAFRLWLADNTGEDFADVQRQADARARLQGVVASATAKP